jgi:hypothetical protein
MRVLFVPCPNAVLPHLIPLLALHARLDTSHDSAFLIPRNFRNIFDHLDLNILDIPYSHEHQFRNEMWACGSFLPDVIVDDMSPTALLTATLSGTPRVSIRRTGDFPLRVPSNTTYRHSSGTINFERYYRNVETVCGISAPKSLPEICKGDMNIIPGIRSIEVPAAPLRDDPRYVFAGGLTLPDSFQPTTGTNPIRMFFAKTSQRKLVYFTLGTTMDPDERVREIIRSMLDMGVAVISSVDLPDADPHQNELFLHASFLPLDTVCAKVHLMVHHCGSGTYQYALRHKVPAICLGSRCFDRDDVARRLEELGAAKYLPWETPDFLGRFKALFSDCIDTAGMWYKNALQSLVQLNAENDRTAAAFDFEAILHKAVLFHQDSTCP